MRWLSFVCCGWLVLIPLALPECVLGQFITNPGALIPAFPPDSHGFSATPAPPVTSIMSKAERRIVKKLDKPRDWNLDRMTIAQFAAYLNDWFPCRVDEKALEDVGLTRDCMLDAFHGNHVSTRVILQILLDPEDLTWTVQDGYVVLTTPEEAEDNLRLLVLPVADLVETPGMGEEGYDFDSLYQLIVSTVSPATWDEGNQSPISTHSGIVFIEQSWPIAHQIEALLEMLRRVKGNETNQGKIALPWYGVEFDAGGEPDLEQHITLSLDAVTLEDLIDRLSSMTTVHFRLDRRALKDIAWNPARQVRFFADNESLAAALRRTLKANGLALGYADGFYVITVKEADQWTLLTRVYPIQDLIGSTVDPYNSLTWNAVSERYLLFPFDSDSIIELLTSIRPESWDEVGGAGNIEYCRNPVSLVINQTWENHARIADLLALLRQARKLQAPSGKQLSEIESRTYVSVYHLADGVPVRKTIRLLRQLVHDTKSDDLDAQQPTYMKPFGQGILVCHTRQVHRRIQSLLNSLGLCPIPSGMGGSTSGGIFKLQ